MTAYQYLAVPLTQREQMSKEANAFEGSQLDRGLRSLGNFFRDAPGLPAAYRGPSRGAALAPPKSMATAAAAAPGHNAALEAQFPGVQAQAAGPMGPPRSAMNPSTPAPAVPAAPTGGGLGAVASNISSAGGGLSGMGLSSSAIPSLNGTPAAAPQGALASMGLSSSLPAINGAPAEPPTGGGLGTVANNIALGGAPATDYNAMFRKNHGTAFDPNSRMDRQKMQAMRGGGQMLASR